MKNNSLIPCFWQFVVEVHAVGKCLSMGKPLVGIKIISEFQVKYLKNKGEFGIPKTFFNILGVRKFSTVDP